MDAILLIADNDVRRRNELRRFFWDSGFLVAAAAHGLECLAELLALEPHVLVIALEIPWGGGDGVIARLNEGLPIGRKPLILVIGDAPADTLSARTGVPPCSCFSTPLCHETCWTGSAWDSPSGCSAVRKTGVGRRKNTGHKP